MSDFMFSDSDEAEEPPKPDETPFIDVNQVSHTNSWGPLLESCENAVERLRQQGTATSEELSRLSRAPNKSGWAENFKGYFWRCVCPMLDSHPDVVWNDCWKFDPDNALTDDEFKEIASGFNIHRSKHSDRPQNHYPNVIQSMYNSVRSVYKKDNPRNGIADCELETHGVIMEEGHKRNCLGYVERFPDIIPPNQSTGDNRPDWEWIGD